MTTKIKAGVIGDNVVGITQLNVSDGSDGQVLTTNGSGTLSFSTVSGTTINNNADNRVITGSGTANTLEGESTLTFGGGKLGIGTTNPSHGLTVSDESLGTSASRRITIKSTTHGVNAGYRFDTESANGTARSGGLYYEPSDTAGASYIGLTGNDSTSHLAVLESGNVGIGTTAPAVSLDIAGSAPYIRITDTRQATWSAGDAFGGIEWYTEDTSANGPLVGASIYTENSQSSALPDQELIFATAPHDDASGPSERLRISSDGNIDAGSNNTTSIRLPNGTTAQRPSSPATGMIRYNTTLAIIEEYRDSAWKALSQTFSGSGGVKTTSGSYTYHTFTSSGSITFNASGTIDILVVAGGGGGGDNSNVRGAGGGAGGLIFISSYPVASTTYTVSVGSGGAEGASGTNSVFSYSGGTTLTALGGGHGGYNDSTDNGADGGSGGGQWYPGYSGASGIQPANTNDGANTYNSTGFGNDGGTSGPNPPYGSGGGGAGAAGGDYNATGGPVGGAGKNMSATFGTSVGESGWFAGGGGAGSYPPNGDVKYDGGQGGGGRGWNNGTEAAQNATANTGGGGGAGGSGGSGIVILRYLT